MSFFLNVSFLSGRLLTRLNPPQLQSTYMIPSLEESFRFTKNYSYSVSGNSVLLGGYEDTHLLEIGRQCLGVNGVAMILRSDMYTSRCEIETIVADTLGYLEIENNRFRLPWYIVSSVSIFQLGGSGPCSQCYELMA